MLEVNKVRDEFENILKALEKRGISEILFPPLVMILKPEQMKV